MNDRVSRVNDLIQEELGKIFLRELEFPKNTLITITRVDTASNIITSKVFVSVIPDIQRERVLRVLNKRIYFIQQMLNKCLKMRPIPRIIFHQEDKTSDAARVEEVLEELKKD